MTTAAKPVPAFPTARTSVPCRIFSVPTEMPWGETWTEAELDEVVANWNNYQAKDDPRFPTPPAYVIPAASVAVGHEENSSIAQDYAERTDLPAVGWPTELRREGKYLTAILDGVPVSLAKWINSGAYKKVSAEFYRDYEGHGPCLRRVSLLGANIPEKKDLGDIPTLVYNPTVESRPNPAAFSESLQSYRAHRHPRFRVDIAGQYFVTFSELTTGAVSMTPEQQAFLAALQAVLPGTDLSQLDGMALDQLMAAANGQSASAEVVDGEEVVKLGEDGDEDDKAKMAEDEEKKLPPEMAKFAEVVNKAVAPLKKQLDAMSKKASTEQLKRERTEVVAFCEAKRAEGKVAPYELDPKVGPTLVDQLLAMPSTQLATFAEGKISPRAAMMKSIDARRPAKFGERLADPIVPSEDTKAEAKKLLSHTFNGRKVLANQAKK